MLRSLHTTLEPATIKAIQQAHIFIVGVGGIGCELLKVMPRVGFKKFTILDLDIIELSNLNRQFYFRHEDIKKSKAEVAKKRLQALDPSLQITAICDSIYKNDYNVEFYRQFDAVVAAIDSNRGRAHIGMMCMRAGIPLVDGGTKSYSGQTQSVIRHLFKCHNCAEIASEHQNFAACTLRNKPERPVHCIVYAKEFYNNFFGVNNTGDIKKEEFIQGTENKEQLIGKIKLIFNALFSQRVEDAKKQESIKPKETNSEINYLTFEEALNHTQVLENPPSTFSSQEFKEQQRSPYNYCKLWSLKTCAQNFLTSMFRTLVMLKQNPKPLQFEKDDEDSMTIVYTITTLRTYNFMNRNNPKNAHKYMTFYKVKDRAGDITPAISSTNSIAAATEVQQLIKVIEKKYSSLNYIQYYNTSIDKVSRGYHEQPNPHCLICSKRYCHVQLQCDFSVTTYRDLYSYVQTHLLGYDRDLEANSQGNYTTIVSKTFKDNLDYYLADLKHFLSKDMALDLQINPDDLTPLCLNLFVKHREGQKEIIQVQGDNVAKRVLEYKRTEWAEKWDERRMELQEQNWREVQF